MKISSVTNAAAKNYQANFKGREESSLPSDEKQKSSLNKWLIAGAALTAIALGGLYFMKSKDPKAAEKLQENLQGALDGAKEKTDTIVDDAAKRVLDRYRYNTAIGEERIKALGVKSSDITAAKRLLEPPAAGSFKIQPPAGGLAAQPKIKTAAERSAAQIEKEAAQVRALSEKTGMHVDTAGKTLGQLRKDRHRLEKVLERQKKNAVKEKAAQDIMEGIERGAIPKPAALRKPQAPVSPQKQSIKQTLFDLEYTSRQQGFNNAKAEYVPQLDSITEETLKAREAAKQTAKTPGAHNSRGANGRKKAAVFQRKINKKAGTGAASVNKNKKKTDAVIESQVKPAQPEAPVIQTETPKKESVIIKLKNPEALGIRQFTPRHGAFETSIPNTQESMYSRTLKQAAKPSALYEAAPQVQKKNISSPPAENAGKKMLDAVNQAEAQKLAEAQHTAQLYTGAVQQGQNAAEKPIAALPAYAASLDSANKPIAALPAKTAEPVIFELKNPEAPAENAGKKMLDAFNQAEARKLAEAQRTAQLYALQQGQNAAAKPIALPAYAASLDSANKQPIAALPAKAASLDNAAAKTAAAASKKETILEYNNRKNAEELQRVQVLQEQGNLPKPSLRTAYSSHLLDDIQDVESRTLAANDSEYANKMRDGVREQIGRGLKQEEKETLGAAHRKSAPKSIEEKAKKYRRKKIERYKSQRQ